MVSAQRITVGTSAVALNVATTAGHNLLVKNTDATNGADLGASDVTAGGGFPLAAGFTVEVDLKPGDVLYAIRSAGADVSLAVLRT
jgi:hypothetical protein